MAFSVLVALPPEQLSVSVWLLSVMQVRVCVRDAIKGEIKKKDGSLVGKMAAQGTTPRRLTDLIGSLCDLTSGSGDKGTPIVYIQGYFDNYTTE